MPAPKRRRATRPILEVRTPELRSLGKNNKGTNAWENRWPQTHNRRQRSMPLGPSHMAARFLSGKQRSGSPDSAAVPGIIDVSLQQDIECRMSVDMLI